MCSRINVIAHPLQCGVRAGLFEEVNPCRSCACTLTSGYLLGEESYLIFSVNKVRGFRRETWLTLGICILAFSLSAGMRLLEVPRWDPAEHQVDGEYILATHDAYFWVAGAEGVNQRSDGTPMSILLEAGEVLFRNSPVQIAFWVPVLLAALVAIPIALWALQLDAPYVALLAAVLGSLAPAFYSRTRLGYYDTDWATLFFPLMISWLLAVWVQPRLRFSDHTQANDSSTSFELKKPVLNVLIVAVGTPWHNFIALYLTSLLWIAAVFIVLFGRKGTRGSSLKVLIAIALTVGLGWVGAVSGLVFLWLGDRIEERFDLQWVRRFMMVLLLILLLILTWIQFESYILTTLSTYASWLIRDVSTSRGTSSFAYPELVASLRETQSMTISGILEGIVFNQWLGILGIFGFAVLLWKKPITFFLLPLLLMGLASMRLGARFAMFAAPVVFLGLFVPLNWVLAQVDQRNKRGEKTRGFIAISGLVIGLVWVYQSYVRLPIESVISKGHVEVLRELGDIAEPESLVWTWWDYGYATQYYTRSDTFADGGRNRGEYLFTLGHVFGALDPYHSAGMVRFATEKDHMPWVTWETWDEDQMRSWLEGLSEDDVSTSTLPPQYIILQWEAIHFLPWIQYFGSWDFKEGEGFVVTVDILDEGGLQHYAYPENAGGPHLLLDTGSSGVILLDEMAYNSTLVQLLISDPDESTFTGPYDLVIDGFPSARVFRLE